MKVRFISKLWINKGTGGLENSWTREDHQNCCIIEIGQNTEMSPGGLRRLAVTQAPVKDHQLTLKWKTTTTIIIMIIIIVIGAFGTVTKGLLKGLEDLEVGGRVETIQTTALLRTARILRRVLETWGDLLSLRLPWKTIGYCWCEKLSWVNNNNNNNNSEGLWRNG